MAAHRPSWRCVLVCLGSILVTGCSDTLPIIPGTAGLPVPDAIRVVKDVDQPANVVERGLSTCERGRTAAGETACLQATFVAAQTGVSDLVKIVPGCRIGIICRYRYETIDRVGFVPATQSTYAVHWQVEFDLRKPVKTTGSIPITVTVI